MNELHRKKEHLETILAGYKSAAVAFSAGVDSTFLLKMAYDVLGDRAIAITVETGSFPKREMDEGKAFCEEQGIRLITIPVDVFSLERFCSNPPDRCYYCKKEIFRHILAAAEQAGAAAVAEGSNMDDMKDYRPGMRAIQELGIHSPLKEAGLTKSDIRMLSRELGLSTWDKPSFACLATRIAYGETITPGKLSMIEQAEQMLSDCGFRQYRVRVHGELARIELLPEDMQRIVGPELQNKVNAYLRSLGFRYVTLDMGGYYTGSMNREIRPENKND